MIVCRFEDEFDTMHTLDLHVINHFGQFRGPLLYSSSPSIQDTKVVVDGCEICPRCVIVRTTIDSSAQRFHCSESSAESRTVISPKCLVRYADTTPDSR